MSIIDNLDKLTPEELAKVGNLIDKFAGRHDREEEKRPQPKPNRKRNRKKRQKEVDNTSERLIVEHGPGRSGPRRRIVQDEYEEAERPRRVGRGRTEPRNPSNQRRRQSVRKKGNSRGGGGVMARTEGVQLSNENKFNRMSERNAEKSDTSIDRKLWSGRMPTQRPEEYEDVEVQCRECQLWFDVNPALVLIDHDTRQPNFVCNNCSPRGK